MRIDTSQKHIFARSDIPFIINMAKAFKVSKKGEK